VIHFHFKKQNGGKDSLLYKNEHIEIISFAKICKRMGQKPPTLDQSA